MSLIGKIILISIILCIQESYQQATESNFFIDVIIRIQNSKNCIHVAHFPDDIEFLDTNFGGEIFTALTNGKSSIIFDWNASSGGLNFSENFSLVYYLKDIKILNYNSLQDSLLSHPSHTKILIFYGDCDDRKLSSITYAFSQQFWDIFRVMYVYFVHACPLDTPYTENFGNYFENISTQEFRINSISYYDPFAFEPELNRYGRMISIEPNRTISQVLTNNKILNLNGSMLSVNFFLGTMVIQKTKLAFWKKALEKSSQKTVNASYLDSFFGVDTYTLGELEKRMKFKSVYLVPALNEMFGVLLQNGTFTGALGDVIYRRSDFSATGFFIKDYCSNEVEFSTATYEDKLCIVTQAPKLIPQGFLLVTIFSKDLWGLIFLTLTLAAVLYLFVRWLHEKLQGTKSPAAATTTNTYLGDFFRAIGFMLNSPVPINFSLGNYEKWFIAFCLLWGLNVIGCFQGSLIEAYTKRKSQHAAKTLEEFDQTGLRVGLRHQNLLDDAFGTNSTGLLESLRRKIVLTNETGLFTRVLETGELAALFRYESMRRSASEAPRGEDGQTLLHLVPECPKTYLLSYLFRKSSVFLRTVNHYLGLLASNGLVTKWAEDTNYAYDFQNQIVAREIIKPRVIVLTLTHLQIAFILFGIGLLISSFVFLLELEYGNEFFKRKFFHLKLWLKIPFGLPSE